MGKRLNIGLMINQLDDAFGSEVFRGAAIAAKEIDANLIVLPGHYIDNSYDDLKRTEFEYQHNTIFNYAQKESIDILLVLIGAIGGSLSAEKKKDFLKQFDNIPIITLACEIEGYPYVCFDNESGLKGCIEHIVTEHGRKKIGFVNGPKNNEDAIARLETFKNTITSFGMKFNEELVVNGRFSPYSRAVVEDLLNRNPDVDGIVFANDAMALGAYDLLEERGIKIGVDISITGFDDVAAAASILPGLTTARAEASDLGYTAVLECINYVETGEVKNHLVQSSVVLRKSCGCFSEKNENEDTTVFNNSECITDIQTANAVCSYLFNSYKSGDEVLAVRSDFFRFLKYFFNIMNYSEENGEYVIDKSIAKNIAEKFEALVSVDLIKYIEQDRLCTVLNFLQRRISNGLNTPTELQILSQLFVKMHQHYSWAVINFCNNKISEMEFLRWQSNSIAKDMLMFDTYDDLSYGSVTDKLIRLHMDSSYIYIFEQVISHNAYDDWHPPENILLKSYHNTEDILVLPAEEQIIPLKNIFRHRYLPDERRYTMIVCPIFINANHYGVFVCELEFEYIYYINSLVAQLCAAMKIIRLIQDKENIRLKLEESLLQIQEKNMQLDTIAKIDELTGIYNRRGFFVHASSVIYAPVNNDKKAIIVFADLNSLKLINDKFSHEDGDFAIKNAAAILCDSFRSTDIIGRIGGDEFAVLALVGSDDAAETNKAIRDRIAEATTMFNESHGKKYLVHMSVGICEFACNVDVDLHELLSKADTLLYKDKSTKCSILR